MCATLPCAPTSTAMDSTRRRPAVRPWTATIRIWQSIRERSKPGETGYDDCDGQVDETGFTDTPIAFIQQSSPTGMLVEARHVFVTFAGARSDGAFDLYVQEPAPALGSDPQYPQYRGVGVFVGADDALQLPDLAATQAGDCVTVRGTVGDFQSRTQLQDVTVFARENSPSLCGTPPSPFMVTNICEIASDVDPSTPGDQPASTAEAFEGALIAVQNLIVTEALDAFGRFRVGPPAGGCNMIVDTRFTAVAPLAVGDTLMGLAGVYDQFGTFRLLPRNENDIVR